jgi:hypothetical protein
MTVWTAEGVAQIIDAELAEPSSRSPHWFVQDGDVVAGLTCRRFVPGGRPPHPAPSLLLLATAADVRAARRIYGRGHPIPRLHVLRGTDLSHWGHGAAEEPAVRVAIGDGIARELRRQGIFREPVLSLPVGLDSAGLPAPSVARQRQPLLLAQHRPELGSALEQALRERGITCVLERCPSSRARLERAIARAPVVVDLAPPTGHGNPAFPWLTAMALRTPLITVRSDSHDDLCRDGRNALVREADAGQLAEAVISLLGGEAEALRGRLLDGARSTVAEHQPALQRLRFEELMLEFPRHWQDACSCHAAAPAPAGSVP